MSLNYWFALPVLAALAAGPADPQPTSGWPGFRGPQRDGVIREPIRLQWDGLTPMWKKPIGGGRASFSIAGGQAFTIEQRKKDEVVAAYDVMTGKERWTHAWPERFSQWMGGGEGPRATPTFHDGLVYALGGHGEMRCLDAATGKLVWHVNILKDNDAKNIRWGMAGSPLIAGDAVIVQPGGSKGKSIAAYERRTGKKLWTALDDKSAYVSPMQVTLAGVPQLLFVTAERLVGLSLDQHKVLWEFPWVSGHDVSAGQPIVIGGNRVFYSSGYGTGAVVVELTKSGDTFGVRQVWRNIRMKNRQSSSVLHNGFVYGLDEGILACIDAATGDLKWKGGRYGHGQILLAADRLIITTEDGELVQVAATPEKLQEIARVPGIQGETWNVPAFGDGILMIRNTEQVAAFDLRLDQGKAMAAQDNDGNDGIDANRSALPSLAPMRRIQASGREFFVSWGYNGDKYTKADMHFSQPSLGNNFTLVGVQARDSKAWTDLFNHDLFVPQYNMRFGLFFNQTWGLEVALDHLKWIVRQDQTVSIKGTLNGAQTDTQITLTPAVLKYQLNNGANPIFFNLVRRVRVAGEYGKRGYIAFLAKAGGGFAWPHTENTLFGQNNEAGFQPFKGWDVDAGIGLRANLISGLYFEVEEKLLYARYFGVKINQGTARHSVKANEFAFHFGWSFR
ncbi:MAG TPA: PQQ-binding-like beta-propeller repeat protein [Vicinamibacterales bacterium]|nr:PQQ-binding-like beta-propeller repeat protein [Vicinamibacterales bacterium]